MLRNIFAVIAGYLAMTVTVIIFTIPLALAFGQSLDPQVRKTAPTATYFILNLAFSFFAAVLGGWVTARIASRRLTFVLGGAVLIFGALYAIQSEPGTSPRWYLIVLPILGASGALTGGHLRAAKANG